MIRIPSHDDRGRPVRLVRFAKPPAQLALLPWRARLLAHTRHAARAVLTSRPGRWILLVGFTLITLVWLTAEFGPQVIAFTLFSPVSSTLIIMISLTGVAIINWLRERADALKRSNIRAGHCPACAYSIASVEPASDGCTVCPECGSAWRTSDPRYTETGTHIVVVKAES